jgi:hypothetical protein
MASICDAVVDKLQGLLAQHEARVQVRVVWARCGERCAHVDDIRWFGSTIMFCTEVCCAKDHQGTGRLRLRTVIRSIIKQPAVEAGVCCGCAPLLVFGLTCLFLCWPADPCV